MTKSFLLTLKSTKKFAGARKYRLEVICISIKNRGKSRKEEEEKK